ncbi:MAG: glycosyltransferase [Planctomycetota bacterium]
MKGLFLIQGTEVPSSRYRVLQFLNTWESAGHVSRVLSLDSALEHWKGTVEEARGSHVVFLHRKRLSPGKIRDLGAGGARLVYDVDDAVMFRDALKPGRSRSVLRQWRYDRTTSAVDQVIVGNSFIAKHTPGARNLAILPTLIDLSRYPPRPTGSAPSLFPTLVWIGDGGSLHYLEKLGPVLDEVSRRVPHVCLKVICNRFPKFESMPVIEVPWSAATEVGELASSDVGLMPLGEDPWSQGKCSLKFLQYLAAGIPGVVTPVGLNADILGGADCGRGARTPEEWVGHLTTLLQDRELCRSLGAKGRALVERDYALEARAGEWVSLVSGSLQQGQIPVGIK